MTKYYLLNDKGEPLQYSVLESSPIPFYYIQTEVKIIDNRKKIFYFREIDKDKISVWLNQIDYEIKEDFPHLENVIIIKL